MKGQRQPPVAGGTLVQLLHRDLPDVEAPAHALGWPISFTDPSASGLVRIRALTLG